MEIFNHFSHFIKETYVNPRHRDTNWDYSDQLIEKTESLYDKLVTFWCTVDGKQGFKDSYRLHFVSVLHEVMVHSTLLPRWLVMTTLWWNHGGIPLECLECQKYLTYYVVYNLKGGLRTWPETINGSVSIEPFSRRCKMIKRISKFESEPKLLATCQVITARILFK